MSIVKREYSAYFDGELHYKFLKEKIINNFSYLFDNNNENCLFDCITHALDAELAEARSHKESYKVAECRKIACQDGVNIYRANIQIEEGGDPHFTEGVSFEFRTAQMHYNCEVVEFDYVNANIYFSSMSEVSTERESRIIMDATYNLCALKDRIGEISNENIDVDIPLYKFITGTTEILKKIDHDNYPAYLDKLKLDESQKKAFNAAIGNDITFIWGPPGTGKSYTLAAIIMALYHMGNERTAICCLSNVAVDQLVNKVVDIIEEYITNMCNGMFYRAGRTRDTKLLKTDFLFPDDEQSKKIRNRIKILTNKIEKLKKEREDFSNDAIKAKAELKDLREDLKEHTDYLISQVKVVFSTISNFVINTRLRDATFDNLIVDEASMLAEPQLIALAKNVTKRIILVGDFQQLSPITVAELPILKTSVFRLCGIDMNNITHPALYQLLNQRRSNPAIVEIINHAFYADRLNAVNATNSRIVARAPYSACVIGMKSVNGTVRFTKGGTRQNQKNAESVMNLLDVYAKEEEENFTIGVITPYKGQVALLKALFLHKEYSLNFQKRIKIGTVHTFQGSECDVIIFDMVDCCKFEKGQQANWGKIYSGEQGEQLLNVAVSRARHKLIVVCEPEFLINFPGGTITNKTYNIFKQLLKSRFTLE